jgi:putative cell wall-binding protein
VGNPCQQPGAIKRISGVDRVGTAIAASNCIGTGGAKAVVLARSDIFPDSLAGTPLAVAVGAPLLLTPPTSLDPRVASEIQRVLPVGATVYLLGGTTALTPQVEQSVRDLGYVTVRYGGFNRFGTAVLIAHLGLNDPQNLFLATGLEFPDALSASSAAAQARGAVLLTADNVMPPETQAYLNSRAGATLFAVGGQATAADPSAASLSGLNRYQTSTAVADKFFPSPTGFGLASGVNFPDALAGGAQVGAMGQPLLISDPNNLSAEIQAYLNAHQSTITGGFLYGGQQAMSDTVAGQAATAIGKA